MKTGIDKTQSSLQRDLNRVKKHCTELQNSIQIRKNYQRQATLFIQEMLHSGRVTREELKEYFKRKNVIDSK